MSHQLTDRSAPIRVTTVPPTRETRRAWLRAALVVVLFALTGAGLGVWWEHLWQPSQGTVVRHEWFVVDGDFRYDLEGLRNQFSGTGLFVVLALAAGALLGGLTALLSRRDELLVLGTVAVGSVVAAVGRTRWLWACVSLLMRRCLDILATGNTPNDCAKPAKSYIFNFGVLASSASRLLTHPTGD